MLIDHVKLLRECKVGWSLNVRSFDGMGAWKWGIILWLIHKPTRVAIRRAFRTTDSVYPLVGRDEHIERYRNNVRWPVFIKRRRKELRKSALDYLSKVLEHPIPDDACWSQETIDDFKGYSYQG